MTFGCLFAIVINNSKQTILLLLGRIFFRWQNFYETKRKNIIILTFFYLWKLSMACYVGSYLLESNFNSIGNSTDLSIFLQSSPLYSNHFKCKINTYGSFSSVICCHALTSWFVFVHVTPSNWSLFTKFSNASFTEFAFCQGQIIKKS